MSKESFTILETLGEGPTTTVYKAVQNVLGRTVLLKVLHRHLLGDAELVERFRREAAALAMLRSEAIVHVYNLDEVEGRPAIVMEYVEGKSLKEHLAKGGEEAEPFARSVAEAVLTALVAAHRQGIIHRDIKPGNILVTPGGAIRITDFGLASILASPSLTVEGVLVGTPAYMSPEQARGESLDVRTDLFSLGVTLVEVISGSQIFAGSSYGECINKIVHFKPESLTPLLAGTSDEFQQFVARLMQPEKEDRFSSAEEALAILQGRPIPKSSSKVRRLAWPAVGLLVAIIAIVFGGRFLSPGGREDGPAAPLRADSGAVRDDSSLISAANVPREVPRVEPRQSVPPPLTTEAPPDTVQVALATQDSGYVSITCSPWAKVYLNDLYIGTTPIAGSVRVEAGTHTLAFNNPQFTPIIRTITVRKDQDLAVDVDFLKSSGFLTFAVKPWAEIYVDDQYRETTPVSQALIVSAGKRTIRFHHPSFPDFTMEITVRAGDTVKVSHDFLTPNRQ